MRLAYSTNGFTQVDLPTAIRRIAEHGYLGVELLADRPHWFPAMDYRERQEVQLALRRTGLAVSKPLAQLPQFVSETLYFLGFLVHFSHYILRWIILAGSLRRSFSRRICWWSVGLEMQRVLISGPERVGRTTSMDRISDSSASTRRASLPSPALMQSWPNVFHRT